MYTPSSTAFLRPTRGGGFEYVEYDDNAFPYPQTIGDTTKSIEGLGSADEKMIHTIFIMPNKETDPDATLMIIVDEVEPDSDDYQYVYVGNINNLPSDVLTEGSIVNDLITGGTSKPLSAEQGRTLNSHVNYTTCGSNAGDQVKLISDDGFELSTHLRLLVLMTNANTNSTPKFNINNTGVKDVWYNGSVASDTNTWSAGEVLDIYYDGINYVASTYGGAQFSTGEKVGDVGIDDEPTAGSENLIKSGGVYKKVSQLGQYIQNLGKPSVGSVYIQQVSGGVIQYIPKHWINEYEQAVLEFSFRTPETMPTSTTFVLTSKGETANDYFYFLSGGTLNVSIGGVTSSISQSLQQDTDYILRWEKDGTTQKFYINGVLTRTLTATPNSCQSVYIGCYPNSSNTEALIKFYYLTIYDSLKNIIENQDASDSFVQMTGDFGSTANFAEYYDNNVIFTSAYYLNETISISNRVLYGNGCRILCGADAKIIIGEDAAIQGFTFIGDWTPTRTTSSGHYAYDPIITDADISDVDNYTSDFLIALRGTNASILNCTIRNIGKTAILCDSLDAYTGSKQVNINGNELYYNKCGIVYKTEFATIGANRINACIIGIYAKGGNLSFVNNNILMADCGIIVGNTGNGGHSEFTGNEIAHCGKYGIYCPELGRTLGNVYSGGQIIDAPIKFINTSLFMIIGCRLNTYYELTWTHESYPQGIEGNSVHSCNVDSTYATRDGKPVFYYPDRGLSLKLNMHPYYVPDADVNN